MTAGSEAPVPRPLAFLVFVGVSLLTRGLALVLGILDIDEASYVVGAWELLRGGLLYTDFADHHPPLVYVYYAIAQVIGGRGIASVQLLTILVTVPLTAWALSAFFRHDRRGLAAGLLYLVYGAAFLPHDMLAVNAELLMLLPACWALVLVREEDESRRPGRVFAAGALLGVAVLFKYQAALWLPAVLLVTARAQWSRRRRALAVAAALAGFAMPLAGTYAYFAARGGAEGLVYWNLIHNLRYLDNPIRPSQALARAATRLIPFLILTAGLWWAAWHSRPILGSPHRRLLLETLVPLSLAAAFLGFRFYPHYFIQLYPPLALAAAPYAAEVFRRPWPRPARMWAASTLLLLAGFLAAGAWLHLARSRSIEEAQPIFAAVADRLRADPCYDGASMFVWGYAPMFYYEAELPMATRFIFPEATLVGYVPGSPSGTSAPPNGRRRIQARHWDWLMQDLHRKRPTYVLDTAPAGIHHWRDYPLSSFPRLAGFVSEHYDWIGSVERVDVYRRRNCASGGSAPR